MNPKVYLSGPISGLTHDQAANWREGVTARLAENNIIGVSPMRGKAYLKAMGEIAPTSHDYSHFAMSTHKGICMRDRYDTQTASAMLLNLLGSKRVSIGSMVEIGWADSARVPIITAMEKDNMHQHAMVDHLSGYVVETLEEAVALTIALLKT